MPKPHNLIYFQSDNHNRDLLGCYGHPLVQTPNLDRLAARRVRFSRAYAASALCCPARAALATGRHIHQSGFWDNAIVYDGSVPSWMHRLRDAGCRTVSIGKLHYRSSEDDNGFDEEIAAMHIVGAKGGIGPLLRGLDDEQVHGGQRELYAERSGVGTSYYQDFDRKVTGLAVQWLQENARRGDAPWVLHVSYPSSHPPFAVPERLYRLYPHERIALPPLSSPAERPEHPALAHLRRVMAWGDLDPELLRRVAAGYYALITHLDEQIGEVLGALEALDLTDSTRILYTTDHGEMHGSHGLLGKCNLYEGSIAVPLVMAGPDIPAGRTVTQFASHVDLFPTLCEAFEVAPASQDADLPGMSLWPAIRGEPQERSAFAEYHAAGSKNASFMVRDGRHKLIYHVGMPPQLFDLEADPQETVDLADDPAHAATLARLEAALRAICDPETVDARAKADQRAKIDYWGGKDAVMAEGMLVITPPPGVEAEIVGAAAG